MGRFSSFSQTARNVCKGATIVAPFLCLSMIYLLFGLVAYIIFGLAKHNNIYKASRKGVENAPSYIRKKSFLMKFIVVIFWAFFDFVIGIKHIMTPRGSMFERLSHFIFLILSGVIIYLFSWINTDAWLSDGWFMKILQIIVSIVALSILAPILRANLTDDQIHLQNLRD